MAQGIDWTAIVTQVLATLGAPALIAGLASFLGAVWLARITSREKARIDEWLQSQKYGLDVVTGLAQHANKARHDLEIRVYGELWKAVRELVDTMNELTHHSEKDSSGPSFRAFNSKKRDFDAAYRRARGVLDANLPFYSPGVNAAAWNVIRKCLDFAAKAEERQPYSGMIHAEAIRGWMGADDVSVELADAIRARLFEDGTSSPGSYVADRQRDFHRRPPESTAN